MRSLLILIMLSLSLVTAQEIVVKPGDSLWSIAQRHNTTVAALRAANSLASDNIKPGQVLHLPESADARPESYIVQAGDTLYDVSLAFGIPVDELIAINNLDGSLIRVGQVLLLERQTPATPLVVTVKQGDSLWSLAQSYDTTVAAIGEANNLQSNVLRVGEKLIIPGRFANTAEDQGGPILPTIVVARGDTLASLARKHSTTVSALMSANSLGSDSIRIGQTLRIVPSDQLAPALSTAAASRNEQAMTLMWPLKGQITSRFGHRRLRVAGSNFHTGLDIAGNAGDPIRAAASGTVTFSGWQPGYGNIVIVVSGDTEYRYAHASSLLVEAGDEVAMGDVIAKVGSTGFSTGPHLHFEILVKGTAVDPLPLLETHATR